MGSRGHSTEDIHTPLGLDMATLSLTHATITSLTHAYVTYTCNRFCYVTYTCFGVGFRGGVSGFRGGVSGWGRDDMRPAWKRGTPQQGHFHMHTPLFGDFRVSG